MPTSISRQKTKLEAVRLNKHTRATLKGWISELNQRHMSLKAHESDKLKLIYWIALTLPDSLYKLMSSFEVLLTVDRDLNLVHSDREYLQLLMN